MAGTFVASFTVAINSTGNQITITDTSNYVSASEPYSGFTSRVVSVTLKDGTSGSLTIPTFPFVAGTGDTLKFTIDRDYSMSINMTCTSASPQSGSVYTITNLYTAVNYTQNFINGILQNISANQQVLNDPIFQRSLRQIYNELSNAQLAGNTYSQQTSAQNALDRAYNIINNSTIYF